MTKELIQKIINNDYQAIYNAGQYGTGNDSVDKQRFEKIVVPFVEYINQHHLIVGMDDQSIDSLEIAQNHDRTSIYFTSANNLMAQLDATDDELILHLDVMGTPLTADLITDNMEQLQKAYYRQLQIFNYEMIDYI